MLNVKKNVLLLVLKFYCLLFNFAYFLSIVISKTSFFSNIIIDDLFHKIFDAVD